MDHAGFPGLVAIDQHVLRRNRQFDLIEVIEAHPQLLGIGSPPPVGNVSQRAWGGH